MWGRFWLDQVGSGAKCTGSWLGIIYFREEARGGCRQWRLCEAAGSSPESPAYCGPVPGRPSGSGDCRTVLENEFESSSPGLLFAGLMLGGGLWTVQAVCRDRVVGGRSLSRAHKALLCELARFWLLFFPFFSVSLRVFPWAGCAGTHGGQTPRENWEN